jgi:dihydroorotase
MEKLFANCKSIIAIHSEKRRNSRNEQAFREQYEEMFRKYHPIIRVPKAVTKLQNVRLI